VKSTSAFTTQYQHFQANLSIYKLMQTYLHNTPKSGRRTIQKSTLLCQQDVTDSGHLTSPENPSTTPKASAGRSTTPPPSVVTPSSPVRPSAYRSMSDTRVKKFDKLLGEQVVQLPSLARPVCYKPICPMLARGGTFAIALMSCFHQ